MDHSVHGRRQASGKRELMAGKKSPVVTTREERYHVDGEQVLHREYRILRNGKPDKWIIAETMGPVEVDDAVPAPSVSGTTGSEG